MKTQTSRRVRLVAVAMLFLSASEWCIGADRSFHDMKKVKQMTATMKTVCVGRFLIDVPKTARVSFGPPFVSGWTIGAYSDETDEQFATKLMSKEAELKAARNERNGVSLELIRNVESAEIYGKIYVFGRSWQYWFESEKRIDSSIAEQHAYVRTRSGMSVDFIGKFSDDNTAELGLLATQIKPLSEGEIPEQPGFCFGPAMILDPLTADQRERMTLFVGFEGHPDIRLGLNTGVGYKPADSLLARHDATRDEFKAYTRSFRHGPRTIGGVPGEEVVNRFNEDNGTHGHSCEWESISEPGNVFRPKLYLEFSTGHSARPGAGPVQSSLADDAMLELWDKISSSIRIRPTKAEPQAVASQPAPPPLGTFASAGDSCPATGWWKCSDGDARISVENGNTQFIRKGVGMPQAVLLPPPTLMQRIKRVRPRFQSSIPTQWKLASYDGTTAATTHAATADTTSSNSPSENRQTVNPEQRDDNTGE